MTKTKPPSLLCHRFYKCTFSSWTSHGLYQHALSHARGLMLVKLRAFQFFVMINKMQIKYQWMLFYLLACLFVIDKDSSEWLAKVGLLGQRLWTFWRNSQITRHHWQGISCSTAGRFPSGPIESLWSPFLPCCFAQTCHALSWLYGFICAVPVAWIFFLPHLPLALPTCPITHTHVHACIRTLVESLIHCVCHSPGQVRWRFLDSSYELQVSSTTATSLQVQASFSKL